MCLLSWMWPSWRISVTFVSKLLLFWTNYFLSFFISTVNYYLFIYLFLGLCWVFVSVRGLSLAAASGGPLFIAVRGPLTIVASLNKLLLIKLRLGSQEYIFELKWPWCWSNRVQSGIGYLQILLQKSSVEWTSWMYLQSFYFNFSERSTLFEEKHLR